MPPLCDKEHECSLNTQCAGCRHCHSCFGHLHLSFCWEAVCMSHTGLTWYRWNAPTFDVHTFHDKKKIRNHMHKWWSRLTCANEPWRTSVNSYCSERKGSSPSMFAMLLRCLTARSFCQVVMGCTLHIWCVFPAHVLGHTMLHLHNHKFSDRFQACPDVNNQAWFCFSEQ